MAKVKKTRNLIMAILSTGLTLFGLAFASGSSFYSGRAQEIAHAQYTAAKCQESENGSASALFNLGNGNYKEISSTFTSIWTQNFLGSMQFIPACVNEDATGYATFSATLDGSSFADDVAVGTSFYFSNQEAIMRLETLCINVYQTRWTFSSLKAFSKDGFVFLPDYYADLLISRSSDMNSYDDLLPVYSDKGSPLSCRTLTLPFGEGTRSWAIVGVYHAKGLNESYYGESFSYNDKDYGQLANSFGSPLLLGFDYDFLAANLNGFFVTSKAQTYVLTTNVDALSGCDKNKEGCARFFTADGESMIEVASSYEIYHQCLQKKYGPRWQWYLFFALSLTCLTASCLMNAKIKYRNVISAAIWTLSPTVFVGLASGIVRGVLANRTVYVGTVVSFCLGLALLIALAINGLSLLAYIKKERRDVNE